MNGHGQAWQKIAMACEETMLERFALDIKLGVHSMPILAEHVVQVWRERISRGLTKIRTTRHRFRRARERAALWILNRTR